MTEAMAIFEEILKDNPNEIEALLGVGICLTYLLVCFWLEITLHFILSCLHIQNEEEQGNREAIKKKKDSIQKYFNRAYHLEPQNPHVLLNFGIFYIEQGGNRNLVLNYEEKN